MDYKIAYKRYYQQKWNCENTVRLDANGDRIEMRMTFEEWANIWLESGCWFDRGRGAGSYCMGRHNDIGHYEVGNVSIIPTEENTWGANKGRKHTKEHREKNAAARRGKPRSEETKRKIGDYQRGRKKSAETREKMRQASLGQKVSEETKAKISAAAKAQKPVIKACPECGQEMRAQNLSRHIKSRHGEGYSTAKKGQTYAKEEA